MRGYAPGVGTTEWKHLQRICAAGAGLVLAGVPPFFFDLVPLGITLVAAGTVGAALPSTAYILARAKLKAAAAVTNPVVRRRDI